VPTDRGERVRIEIAFEGGHVITALVPVPAAESLERALDDESTATLALDADDGQYTVALRRVLYVKRFAREARVGFGA
jgi:hypothetical protein